MGVTVKRISSAAMSIRRPVIILRSLAQTNKKQKLSPGEATSAARYVLRRYLGLKNLKSAARLLNETRGQHLFELSIDPRDVFHRADLRIYDEIVRALQKGEEINQLVRQFWEGVEMADPG